MKQMNRLPALLLALALCLGLLTGCGDNQQQSASQAQEEPEPTESQSETSSDAGQAPDTDGEVTTQPDPETEEAVMTPEEEVEGSEVASNQAYTIGDLELTRVNEDISTLNYISCNGQTITVPVLNSANWDNTQVADDMSFVELTNLSGREVDSPEGGYYCTYYSEEQAYYDQADMAEQYAAAFADQDGTSNATVYPATTSPDGTVQAMAVHGFYQSWEIYQYLITVEYGEEYAVLDLSFYTDDPSVAAPILDYFALPDPVTAS